MTEMLKHLMHEQASAPHFDPVDPAVLIAAGDRRVRRRRWSGIAAGAVAAVAVAAVAPAVLDGPPAVLDPAGQVVTGQLPGDAFAGGRVTWSVGPVIHYGDVTVDVGMPVDAFVHTGVGFVVASDGAVWQVGSDGTDRIGSIDARHPRLVSDEATGKVAWIDTDGEIVAFDHRSGTATPYDGYGASDVFAIDGGTAYLADSRGVVALDLTDGTSEVIRPAPTGDVLDAQDDLLASSTEEGTAFGSAQATETVVWRDAYGSLGAFSGDARYYTTDADEAMLYDVHRGTEVDLDLDEYWFSTGYGWIGDRTLAVLAMRSESAPMELLTCRVPEGDCASYTTLGSQEEVAAQVQLPVGQPIED